LRRLISKNDTIYSVKWIKIGVNIGIYLGKSHGNFKLHRFTSHRKWKYRKKF